MGAWLFRCRLPAGQQPSLGGQAGAELRQDLLQARHAVGQASSNRGLAEDAIPVDDMLDTISLYWFTNTAASSARTTNA